MSGQASIWDEPRVVARRTDPQTSWAAAQSVGKVTETMWRIVDLFMDYGPMTHEQLIEVYRARHADHASVSGIRSRCNDLVKVGRVVDTGERGKTESGRASIVWGLAR